MTPESLSKPLLLVFPFGYLSHYLRCLELAKLFRVNFEVQFASNETYDRYVWKEGFTSFPCEGMDAGDTLAAVSQFDFSWLNERSLEKAMLAQVAAVESLQPAALLGDASPTLKMAADKTGVPLVSLINGYMSKFFAGFRALSITHPAYPFVKRLPPKMIVLLTAQGEAMGFKAIHKPFRVLRRKWQLPPTKTYLDEMEGDFTLITDLISIFPQKKLPPTYRVIAPLFYDGEDELVNNQMANRKTIFVSMGSTGNWQNISLLNDPVFAAYHIIAAGDKDCVLQAPHIHSIPFGDASTLFPQVDLVICHGGNGSVYQALAYGIPVLCYPSHFEQEWNVAAIEQCGLGKNIATIKKAAELIKMIERWIGKKDSTLFVTYKDRIAFYKGELRSTMLQLTQELLPGSSNI